MISKQFIKSSFIYTITGTLPMASAIILLPFYIHYLSTDDFGALSIYLGFSALVQILVTFSFDSSLYVYFHDYKSDKNKLAAFTSSIFVFILLIGLAQGIVLTVCGDFIFSNFFTKQKIDFFPFGVMSIVTALFQAVFKVYSTLLQSRERPVAFLWSNVTSFGLIALLSIGGMQLIPQTLYGPIAGRMVAAMISGIIALISIFNEFGFHFDYSLIRTSFSFNRYAFIYQIQQWIINNFDRMLMAMYLPLSDVGVYDFAIKCLLIIEFLVNGFANSFLPKVIGIVSSQIEKKTTQEINRYYYGLTAVIMLLCVLSIFGYPVVINLLIKKEQYLMAVKYIPYAAIIYLFRGMRMYFGIPYSALKYTKPLPLLYLFVSAIKISILILLVEKYGIYGVILSSLMSYLVEIVLLYYTSKKIIRFEFNSIKMVVAPFILAFVILVVELTLSQGYPLLVHFGYVLLSVFLIVWAFRKELYLIKIPFIF